MIFAEHKARIFAGALAILGGSLPATICLDQPARAQSIFNNNAAPTTGGAGFAPLAQKPAFGGLSGPAPKLHYDVSHRACIEIHGYAEPQTINLDIYNHMLLIANICSFPVKLHICYYQSEHCINVTAPPYARKLETLGIFPHMQDFRWEYTEGFN